MMTLSTRMGLVTCPYDTIERLGMSCDFQRLFGRHCKLWVIVIRASSSQLRAHVKDGDQTAWRHNLIFTHFSCVFEHSLPFVVMSPYHPMIALRCCAKAGSARGLVRTSAICCFVGVASIKISLRSTCSRK